MAADFWVSSHYKRWIVDRATLRHARYDDLQFVDDPEYLDYLSIYFANLITKLGKKLQFRQRIIATATVFFRRFYLKNYYCETDPFTVIAACCYLAAKAEESPVHIKVIVAESKSLFSQENYGARPFTSDNSKIAEMEFYLVDDLECDLVVFHPYRTLLALCRKEDQVSSTTSSEEGETADEPGVGVDFEDGPRYWGTGDGQLAFTPAALQTAWSIINDSYRSQLCLLYPPHLIAIAAIYLTFILHPPVRPEPEPVPFPDSSTSSSSDTLADNHHPDASTGRRRSSRQAHHPLPPNPNVNTTNINNNMKKPQDPIAFLADLNVSLPTIATITQEIIAMYTLWEQYSEDASPDAKVAARELTNSPMPSGGGAGGGSPAKRTVSRSDSMMSNPRTTTATTMSAGGGGGNGSAAPTPGDEDSASIGNDGGGNGGGSYITPAFLSSVLQRMREAKVQEVASGVGTVGRAQAVNKRLERAQAAG